MTQKNLTLELFFFRLGRLQTLLLKNHIVHEVVCFPIACHICMYTEQNETPELLESYGASIAHSYKKAMELQLVPRHTLPKSVKAIYVCGKKFVHVNSLSNHLYYYMYSGIQIRKL